MSFVIWIKIPYTRENEQKIFPEQKTVKNGCFEFLYTNSIGSIAQHGIQLEKNFDNIVVVFPANMPHCVYPFYSSDEYRISVSGNFKLLIE